MKKNVILLTLVSIFIITTAFASAADNNPNDPPEEVIIAAEKSLEFVKDKISEDPEKFGFDGCEVEDIELSKAFRLYYINKEKFLNNKSDSLEDIWEASTNWEFIINTKDEAKIILTLGYIDGEYKLVHFGGNARILNDSINNFKELTNNNNPKVLQIRGQYYLVNKNGEDVLPAFEKDSLISKKFNNMNNKEFQKSKDIITYLYETQTDGRN